MAGRSCRFEEDRAVHSAAASIVRRRTAGRFAAVGDDDDGVVGEQSSDDGCTASPQRLVQEPLVPQEPLVQESGDSPEDQLDSVLASGQRVISGASQRSPSK